MRILYVVPYVPNPVRVRPFHFIRSLAELGHSVSLSTLWSDVFERTSLEGLTGYVDHVEGYRLTPWRKAWNIARALPSTVPLQAAFCWNPALARSLVERVRSDEFDLVHVEHIRGAKYALLVRDVLRQEGKTTPVVWDSVDCISELFRLASSQSRSFFGRWVTRFELPRTARYEARLIGAFDSTLVTSAADREALLGLSGRHAPLGPIEVVPNGVDLDYFSPSSNVPRRTDQIVMTGKMSYHANVTMVLDFVETVFPIIKHAHPEVSLKIVGKDPSPEIMKLAENRSIEVTGTVPDLRPYLWQSTLAVAPLTYSVGIQNKVLEALATGTPVVTTPQVAKGINLKDGDNALIADDPVSFAGSVVRLLDEPRLRDTLGGNGRSLVEQEYDWKDITLKLLEVYRELIDAHR